jgi:hypothetical protein
VPGQDEGGDLSLYHGSPGVILFLLELHSTTGDAEVLADAEAGSHELLAVLESGSDIDPGLYTGLAGIACALDTTARVTGSAVFGTGAATCVDRIVASVRPVGDGVAWFADDPANASSDIVSGASGIGFMLLDYAERHGHAGARSTALAAARHLATLGQPAPGGLKWRMMPSFERLMPNFSHGTAGVAAFLARAHGAEANPAMLDAAVRGARYLEDAGICDDDGCRVFHHEPEGEDLFYLSWCHGPAGTARLFYQLAEVTGDTSWLSWLEKGARGIRYFGGPETRSPGYWNNISQCCGDAGVGEYFLALHAISGDAGHLEYAQRIGAYIQGKSDGDGASAGSWTQSEHRTQPDLLEVQTGWMQGAAGVGAFFLHLDARERGRSPLVTLPDTPWGSVL